MEKENSFAPRSLGFSSLFLLKLSPCAPIHMSHVVHRKSPGFLIFSTHSPYSRNSSWRWKQGRSGLPEMVELLRRHDEVRDSTTITSRCASCSNMAGIGLTTCSGRGGRWQHELRLAEDDNEKIGRLRSFTGLRWCYVRRELDHGGLWRRVHVHRQRISSDERRLIAAGQ